MAKATTLETTEPTVKVAKAKDKTLSPCGCGCHQLVRRSYAIGHDAKHKGALLRQVRDVTVDSTEAEQVLVEKGWRTRHQIEQMKVDSLVKAGEIGDAE